MRAISALLCVSLLMLGAMPTLGTSGTAGDDAQIFFADRLDDLDGWYVDEGWNLTDNRARNGTALYFGDDAGTATPDDNVVRCDPCRATATSPSFALPTTDAIFLYFWLYGSFDDFFGRNHRSGLSVSAIVDGNGPELILQARPIPGGMLKADLGAFSGKEIRLSVTFAQPEAAPPWAEGAYLDDIIVTDTDIRVANELELSGSAAAVDLSFVVPEEGAHGILLLGGIGTAEIEQPATFIAVYHNGRLIRSIGWSWGSPGENVDVTVGGKTLFSYNGSATGGTLGGLLTKHLDAAKPGHWRYVTGFTGTETAQFDAYLFAASALQDVQWGLGGAQVAHLAPREFATTGTLIGVNGRAVAMTDGGHTETGPGRAMGFFSSWSTQEVSAVTGPDGSDLPAGVVHTSETAGVWRYDIERVVGGGPHPWFHLLGLPDLNPPADWPVPDDKDLPGLT